VTSIITLIIGYRDLLFAGTPLPFPGDEKLVLLFGSKMVKKQKVAAPPTEEMRIVLGFLGMYIIGFSILKLVSVFTAPEGTYLRRNIFAAIGATELLMAANVLKVVDPVLSLTGFDGTPWVAMYTFSGLVFLADALLRVRKPKTK